MNRIHILVATILLITSNNIFAQLDDDFAISPNAIGHFQYYENRAIFPSTKNDVRNEEMWQFRYFPLFIPKVEDNGNFVIGYDQLDEDTWYVEIHLWRDNNKAKELAFEKIIEIYRNEVKANTGEFVEVQKIKRANVYAIPVSQIKVLSIDGIHKDVNWTLAKETYNSIGTSGILKVKLKVKTEEDAKLIQAKSKFLNIRLAFDVKTKKVKFNSCNIGYKDLQQSKLYTSLKGIGKEGYVHRNDLRDLVKNVTKEVNIDCTIEEGSRYQAELEIYQNIINAWIQNEESVEFNKIEFDKTYNGDDLKPDVYEKNLNELHDKLQTENRLEKEKSGNLKLKFGKYEFGGGGSKKKITFEKMLNENKVKFEWNGEKYIPKAIDLIRYNLSVFDKEGTINSSIQYVSDSEIGNQLVDIDYGDFTESEIQSSHLTLNSRISKLEEDVLSLKNSHGSVVPIGTIISYSTEFEKGKLLNWLPCDGRVLSKKQNPVLFNRIRYTWGGEGNNFNLPNLDGQFLRGIDKMGKVDNSNELRKDISGKKTIGPVVGSYQNDATKLPDNEFLGQTEVDGRHQHNYKVGNAVNGHDYSNTTGGEFFGNNAKTLKTNDDNISSHQHKLKINGGGDIETRPKNVYVQFLIKIK